MDGYMDKCTEGNISFLVLSNFCFTYVYRYRLWNKNISKYEGGLVTLGLEAGRDILPSRVKFHEHSLAVVHLADSAGLGKQDGRDTS